MDQEFKASTVESDRGRRGNINHVLSEVYTDDRT